MRWHRWYMWECFKKKNNRKEFFLSCKCECLCHFAQGFLIVSCIYHHVFSSRENNLLGKMYPVKAAFQHSCLSNILKKKEEKKSVRFTSLSVCDIYPLVNNYTARRVSSRNETDSNWTLAPGAKKNKLLGDAWPLSCFVWVKAYDSVGFTNFHGSLAPTVLHVYVNELAHILCGTVEPKWHCGRIKCPVKKKKNKKKKKTRLEGSPSDWSGTLKFSTQSEILFNTYYRQVICNTFFFPVFVWTFQESAKSYLGGNSVLRMMQSDNIDNLGR